MDDTPFVPHKGNLTVRYITAYLVEGLQTPKKDPLELYSAPGKKVFLAGNDHEDWNHIDTVLTIANITLTMMLQGRVWDLSDFASHISTTRQERISRYGPKPAFLFVEASHQEDGARIGPVGISDQRDFCLALPNGFRDEVEQRHQSFIDRSKAALSFGMPSVVGLLGAGSCILANHPSGKPLYILTSSISVTPTLSAPVDATSLEGLEAFFEDIESLNVESVMKLAADSISNRRDNLRAFLSGYTSLEGFVGTFFSNREERLHRLNKADLTANIHSFVEGVRKEKSKTGSTDYSLRYRFALVASYLSVDNPDNALADFDDAKCYRNKIAHGKPYTETDLPTGKVHKLLGELVRLSIKHQDPPD
jgi:hypothetical protein